MKILVVAKLKPSQIKYKIQPLLNSDLIDEIIVLRKLNGPKLPKLKYIILPNIFKYKIFYVLFTPFLSIYYSKKHKVDLIIGYHFVPHGFNAYFAHIFTKIPFIYAQIDMDIEHYCKNMLLRFFIKKILSNASYILVPGRRSQDFWNNMGIDVKKVKILHSSIDTQNHFYPIDNEKIYDLLFIGTLDGNKRILEIIKAVNHLIGRGINIKFAIAGFGPLQDQIISFIKVNNLERNIYFLGKVNDVLNLINSSKIFIMASKFEGLPCALMEAMACEKIVITTPAGDIPDIVRDGETGFLIMASDYQLLSNQILLVLQNFNNYSKISSNARQIIIENHSYKTSTLKWNRLLSEIKNENIN